MYKIILFPFVLIFFAHNAFAQENDGNIPQPPLDMDLQIEDPLQGATNPELHDDGKYNSQAVGKGKKWELDSGEFDYDSTAPHPQKSSNDTQGYSGIRLRLPTGPK